MEMRSTVALVTGGASGIGKALATRFLAEGAAGVTIVDLDPEQVASVAADLGERCLGVSGDVSQEAAVRAAVDATEERFGPLELFCANAGIGTGAGIEASDDTWRRIFAVNVLSHAVAARVMIPRWLERGGGQLLVTASAAGLLSNLGDAPYTATKHAAVGLAEWIAITYGDRGVRVACLCPQGVNTPMVTGGAGLLAAEVVVAQGLIEPEAVADTVIEALRDGRFWVLPHPEVAEYVRRKANDVDRWLAGMRRLQARIDAER
jgi:NAD(P)-dependent dehydrogenase (short-subunit alcohol dehydrogenase family)